MQPPTRCMIVAWSALRGRAFTASNIQHVGGCGTVGEIGDETVVGVPPMTPTQTYTCTQSTVESVPRALPQDRVIEARSSAIRDSMVVSGI